MDPLIIVGAVFIIVVALAFLEIYRTPAGIERDHRIERGRIFSSTRATTKATPEEVIRLLQTDWSWWRRARVEPMKDLGEGRKEFRFHPVRLLGLIETPPVILVHFDRVETLPDGGRRICASLSGDFDGRAEYSARPGPGATIVEMAWHDVERRNMFRFQPAWLVEAVHGWRERVGIQGLRDRLRIRKGVTASPTGSP